MAARSAGTASTVQVATLQIDPIFANDNPPPDPSGTLVVASVSGPCRLGRLDGSWVLSEVYSTVGTAVMVPINTPSGPSSCNLHLKVIKPAGLTGGEGELNYDVPIQVP